MKNQIAGRKTIWIWLTNHLSFTPSFLQPSPSDTKPWPRRSVHGRPCLCAGLFPAYWGSPLCLAGAMIPLYRPTLPTQPPLPSPLHPAPSSQLSPSRSWSTSTSWDVSWRPCWSWPCSTLESSGAYRAVWRRAVLKPRLLCSGRRGWPAPWLWFSFCLPSAGFLCTWWTVCCCFTVLRPSRSGRSIQAGGFSSPYKWQRIFFSICHTYARYLPTVKSDSDKSIFPGILLSHANSAVNPVVYAYRIPKIQQAYNQIWRRFLVNTNCCQGVEQVPRSRTSSRATHTQTFGSGGKTTR